MSTSRLWLGVLLTFIAAPPAVQTSQPPAPATSIEELIAEKDPSCRADDEEDVVSRDGRRVAWRMPVRQKWTVMVNGVAIGGAFDEVRSLYFSPDGTHVVYQARTGRSWTLMVDGQPVSGPFDDLRGPVFNPVTSDIAYAARRDKQWRLVAGSNAHGGPYADLRLPVFSDDGRRMVYGAKTGKKWTVVVDGAAERSEFDQIVMYRFSPDGSRLAYVGRRENDLLVVVDGREGLPFEIVGGLTFSANGRRVGYAGANVRRGFGSQRAVGRVVVDGVAGPEFEGVQIGSLLKGALLGVDRLVVGHFWQLRSDLHGVSGPAFAPDAQHVAYAARTGKDAAAVIVDGAPAQVAASIPAGPVFSADGRLAFMTRDDGGRTVVIDGTAGARMTDDDTDFVEGFSLSPDGRHAVSISVKGGTSFEHGNTTRAKRRVYVDGTAHPVYDAHFLGAVEFSKDGEHMMYVVGRASGGTTGDRTFVVLDGRPGNDYDAIFSPVRFEPDGRSIRYIARAGRRLYAVRQGGVATD